MYLITYSVKVKDQIPRFESKVVQNPFYDFLSLPTEEEGREILRSSEFGSTEIIVKHKISYALINIIEIPARYVKDLKTFLKDKEEQIEETDN